VLIFDAGDCAALQRVEKQKGGNTEHGDSWVDISLPPAVPEDPVFVVNIGDCLSELSGLPSTLHRVVPRGRTPRNCLALFVGLESSQILHFPGEEDPISYGEWRKRRIARAQQVLTKHRGEKQAIVSDEPAGP